MTVWPTVIYYWPNEMPIIQIFNLYAPKYLSIFKLYIHPRIDSYARSKI